MYFCNQIVKCHNAMIQIPIESMNLMMLNVGYATHHADWNWQKVSSPFIRIFYIMEGEAMLHLPDKDVRLKPGYMYIIPAFVIHSYECHGVFKLYYIHMYEGFKNMCQHSIPTLCFQGLTRRATIRRHRLPIMWSGT